MISCQPGSPLRGSPEPYAACGVLSAGSAASRLRWPQPPAAVAQATACGGCKQPPAAAASSRLRRLQAAAVAGGRSRLRRLQSRLRRLTQKELWLHTW